MTTELPVKIRYPPRVHSHDQPRCDPPIASCRFILLSVQSSWATIEALGSQPPLALPVGFTYTSLATTHKLAPLFQHSDQTAEDEASLDLAGCNLVVLVLGSLLNQSAPRLTPHMPTICHSQCACQEKKSIIVLQRIGKDMNDGDHNRGEPTPKLVGTLSPSVNIVGLYIPCYR